MDQHLHGNDLLRAFKARAAEIRAQAEATGEPMKQSAALEAVAKERGFRDWNAAAAAAKARPTAPQPRPQPLWRDLNRELPVLPIRFWQGESRVYEAVQELMRRAKQIELIALNVPKEARREMLTVIGGRLPYVFEQSRSRWGDDLYRLLDRGYDPWKGITMTREQLVSAGVDSWNQEHGSHDGKDAFSVVSDVVGVTSDAEKLRGMARVLASIAMTLDAALAQEAKPALQSAPVREPKKRIPTGVTIDLNDPEQFTAENVAKLIGSKDDSEHRQVRVTKEGIAYLSDVVGNIAVEGLAFRLETWTYGKGYVGQDAAQDEEWVETVLEQLREHWPKPRETFVDW